MFVLPIALSGCGLYVPEKQFLSDDAIIDDKGHSRQGSFENDLVGHIKCEIEKGILRVKEARFSHIVPWLYKEERLVAIVKDKNGKVEKQETDLVWGTAVYLQVQVEEQSQLNPGVSVTEPFHNAYGVVAGPNSLPLTPASLAAPTIAAIPQNFNLGIGASATAHATRQETIQFTLNNAYLLQRMKGTHSEDLQCDHVGNKTSGVMIESNLKIDDFIYDKAALASYENIIDTGPNWAPYNTFQEQLTFVASYEGGVTPTWKFARASVNPSSPTLAAQRTDTNTLIITLGQMDPSKKPGPFVPQELVGAGATQHNAAAAAALIGGANRAAATQ